jgi:N-acetylmuramoyl-L-alanine amidase
MTTTTMTMNTAAARSDGLGNMARRLWMALMVALLAGCATTPSGVKVDRSYTAVSQDDRIKFLIIHYTAEDSAISLKTLTQDKVSAHYLLDDGAPEFKIYGLVDESRRAWQAGISYWKGNTNLNSSSIGIEIVNLGWRDTPQGRVWYPFPQGQIDRLIPLVQEIMKRHDITPDRVLGHSDIAPQRKQDPGPLFPWKRLADAGLVLWPDEAEAAKRQPAFEANLPDVAWFQKKLDEFGYAVPRNGQMDEVTRNVVSAFQMKYRPAKIDGSLDAQTAALLDVLVAPVAGAPAVPATPASAPAPNDTK